MAMFTLKIMIFYIHTSIGFATEGDDVAAVVGFSTNTSLSTSLPGSGTNKLNLTMTSNVNIPGIWMFQVDGINNY